jgi:H+-transporting ATPase
MGSSVVRGEVEGTVESTGAATFFGKTAALLAVSTTAVLIELMLSDVLISPQLLLLLFFYCLTANLRAE